MRKDKRGQPPKLEFKKKIRDLRRLNYSFSEIGDLLKISRQLALYHSKKLSTSKGIDKDNS